MSVKKIVFYLSIFLRSKFIFKNPQKVNFIIFDDESIDELKNIIKERKDYFVLQIRPENFNKLYITFAIFKNLLKNYSKLEKKNIFTAYFISLIQLTSPKLVLTNIDNSQKFWEIAKFFNNKIKFVAIQNAVRDYEMDSIIVKTDQFKETYIPHFFCFGNFEVDYYKKKNIAVKNFYPSGSLRLANFFNYLKEEKVNLDTYQSNICIVSEQMNEYRKALDDNNFSRDFIKIVKYGIKFCIKNNKKMNFAIKRNKEKNLSHYNNEINFYKDHLSNEEFNYLIKNSTQKEKKIFSSYLSVYCSDVTLGVQTSMLREKLAMGGKILSCNLTKYPIFNFPIKGICTLNNCNYNEFEERLNQILMMKNKDYISRLSEKHDYLISYDPNYSVIQHVKDKFLQFDKNLNNTSN
jgi:surface carbohydrate biosynthesis protein|tara:strand:- start:9570 stop:10787 length:1218 start_codon:yes stop_codon:yes gene_type:complete